MSLLSQEPTDSQLEAAPGESYTKGSGHMLIAGIVAVVLVTIAVAVYVVTGEKPPASTGEILDVWAHPMHTESS